MKKLIVIIVLSFFICSPVMASIESDINAERARARLPKFKVYSGLQQTSAFKVNDMIAWKYFAHINPFGDDVLDILDRYKISYLVGGENLARGYSGKDLINAWMASPTHRANILDLDFNKVGCYSKNGLTACHFIK